MGDADIPDERFDPLAALVAGSLRNEPLFLASELPREAMEWVERIVTQVERGRRDRPVAVGEQIDGVVVDQVEHSHSTLLRPLVVGLHAWNALGMGGLLVAQGFSRGQRQAACALVLGRLAEPMSEHAFYHYLPYSGFPDLLGSDVCSGGVQPYYRAGDKLLERSSELESAVRGRNKQKRNDCPQIVVGVVFDEFG